MYDSDTATFRVLQEKLQKLQPLLRAAVDEGQLIFRILQRIAGKCMNMTVAIRPASLWTYPVFGVIVELEKCGQCTVDFTHDCRAGLPVRRVQAAAYLGKRGRGNGHGISRRP